MAKQQNMHFIGTVGNICFYSSRGGYYMRAKSSLSGKRVKTSPAFRKTMEQAQQLGQASSIASFVYQSVPPEHKSIRLFRLITGEVIRELRQGYRSAKEIKDRLVNSLQDLYKELHSGKDPRYPHSLFKRLEPGCDDWAEAKRILQRK